MKITPINSKACGIFFKGGYQSSKYQYADIKKDIYQPCGLSHTKNCQIDRNISSDEEIEKYSAEKIREIVPEMLLNSEYEEMVVNSVAKALRKGDVHSSNLEMVLELVEAGALSKFILFYLYENTKLNRNAQKDLEKLFDAYINKKDAREVFCPQYQDDIEADEKTAMGDVFVIRGEPFIKIKSKDGIKNLFITRDTYLELFPPIERFSPIQARGDCYLVAAADSLYQNPAARDKILELFFEDDDGVNISFNEQSYKIKNISEKLNKALQNDNDEYAYQSEALRAIEALWQKDRKYNFYKKIQEKYEMYLEISNLMGTDKKLSYNGFDYSKDEVNKFLKLARYEMRNGFEDNSDILGFLYDKHDAYKIEIEAFLMASKSKQIFGKKRKSSKFKDELGYLAHVFERYFKYMKKHKLNKVVVDEVFPIRAYYEINRSEFNQDDYLEIGGRGSDLLYRLNIDSYYIDVDTKEFKDFLKSQDLSDYIYTASTNSKKSDDPFFQGYHLYSLDIEKKDDEFFFILRDPNNSIFEKTCNLEDFRKNFQFINVAKI